MLEEETLATELTRLVEEEKQLNARAEELDVESTRLASEEKKYYAEYAK